MPNSSPPKWSVKTLIICLIVACLLPAVGGTVAFFVHMYRSGRAQLELNTLQTARALVSALDGQLTRAQIVGEALATSHSLALRDFPSFHQRSLELLQRESAGSNIVLVDRSGQQIVNTLRPYGAPLPRHGNFEQVQRVFASGKPEVSDVFSGGLTPEFKASVDIPVFIDGTLAYVVSVLIPPAQLQHILLSQHLPNDWLAGIFDRNGTTAARTKLHEEYVGKKGVAAYVNSLQKTPEATLATKTAEGIPSLIIYSTSPTSHWSVAIAIPRASLEAELSRNIFLLAVGTGILFSISIGLAWMTGGLISRSINALGKPALALERGEVVPIHDMHFREAYDVGQAMTRTAELLSQRTAELNDLNLDLEKKVEIRSRKIDDLHSLLQEVIESLPFGVVVFDEQRNLNLRNRLYADLLELPPDLFIRHPLRFDEIVRYCFDRGDYGDVEFAPLLAGFVDMMAARKSICIERPQANGTFLEIRGLPILSASTLLTYTDITSHKLAEKALETAKKTADAATVAKSTFLASMSHEIRTPLNAIIGLAYLLGKADLPEHSGTIVRKITMAGRSLLSIVNDILDFSRIEAGQIRLEQARFSLEAVLDNLSSIMYGSAADKNIELVITPPQGGVNWLEGDALRLEQILINLVGNGIKFTEHGHVEVNICAIAQSDTDITLRFAVRDTGIGISKDQQHSIFDAFSQGDTSTTRRFGGSGLGLTISHRFVALMGGQMGVNSAPGEGSEFWFSLPFRRSLDSKISDPEMARLELLIADDNAIARHALRRVTLGLGWTAHVVDSGTAAVSYVAEQARLRHGQRCADVILLDWEMPGMDGLSAARAMRDAVPTDAHAPIIIMVTAHSVDELHASPHSELADVILNKPVTASMLYNAVATVMRMRNGARRMGAPAVLRHRLAGIRLLVADDSEINREVATRILEDEGAEVACVENGKQAVEWLMAHPGEVDVVLMDVQMPVMDGYDATRAIRAERLFLALPVIALTAGAFKNDEDAARAAGMSGFISKPFDVDATIALILKHAGAGAGVLPETTPAGDATDPSGDGDGDGDAIDFPGIAVERGLSFWKDADIYHQYLRKFARDYGNSAVQLQGMEHTEAATLLHTLIGVAGSLALHELASAARDADRVLRAGKDPADSYARLAVSMRTALASIDRLAPTANEQAAPVGDVDAATVAALLVRAIRAFDSDNPAVIKPVLRELASLLPRYQTAAMHDALENYDFRGGEAAVRSLATSLNLPIGN